MKKVLMILLAIVMFASFSTAAFAETVYDKLCGVWTCEDDSYLYVMSIYSYDATMQIFACDKRFGTADKGSYELALDIDDESKNHFIVGSTYSDGSFYLNTLTYMDDGTISFNGRIYTKR